MTFDKFTIKAQEAVQAAVNIAQRNGQQTIEPVHLLSGIIEKAPDVTNYIFQKLGMNGNQIAMLLQQEMQHLPRVQGAGQPYLSGDTNQILINAEDNAKKMGDEFEAWSLSSSLSSKATLPLPESSRMRVPTRRTLPRPSRLCDRVRT